ncbi:MAG: hypothetical protein ACOC23_05560 [Thermodesulfobacteriota bacterium]
MALSVGNGILSIGMVGSFAYPGAVQNDPVFEFDKIQHVFTSLSRLPVSHISYLESVVGYVESRPTTAGCLPYV